MRSLPTLLLLLSVVVSPVLSGGGSKWTYQGSRGPQHWAEDYEACGGKKQSPIDIETSNVELDKSMTKFNLSQLDRTDNVEMKLENVEGHTVEVHMHGKELMVEGGGLEGAYGVDQFHFHWGAKDARGSEHTINDVHFPMEMHIVMYSHNYTNISVAVTKRHGLAVLGFLFKVGELNSNFEQLLRHFGEVEFSEEKYDIPKPFPLSSLIPEDSNSFYRYEGSLTTPPCSETVVWTLFTKQIEVAEEQLKKFRRIKRSRKGEKIKYLTDDFRPTQPRNGRVVKKNAN